MTLPWKFGGGVGVPQWITRGENQNEAGDRWYGEVDWESRNYAAVECGNGGAVWGSVGSA